MLPIWRTCQRRNAAKQLSLRIGRRDFQQHVKRTREPEEVVLKRRREQVRAAHCDSSMFC